MTERINYPIELFCDEYRDNFDKISLKYCYYGHENDLGSQDYGRFIMWFFNDVVNFILNEYDAWKNKYLRGTYIDGYEDKDNTISYSLADYKLKERLTHYLNNVHPKYVSNKLSSDDIVKVIDRYTSFVYLSINSGDCGDYKNINKLIGLLFDKYHEKVNNVGVRNYRQYVSCSMNGSYYEYINVYLTIDRDYWAFGNEGLVEKYIRTDGTFEKAYNNEFKDWYDNIVTITNNFSEDMFDKYINENADAEENIINVFKMPHHVNMLLVEHMINKYNLKIIPRLSTSLKVHGNMLIEKTYALKSNNLFIQDFTKWTNDWCIITIIKKTIG